MIGLGVLVYKDDVLIYAETHEQLIEILSAVLKFRAKGGLKSKASKCSLLTQKIHYLGLVVQGTASNLTPQRSIKSNSGLHQIQELNSCHSLASATNKET